MHCCIILHANLQTLLTVTMNTIKSWHEEAKTILAKKQKTSKKINLSWKEIYVKNLDLYQALWNSLTADEIKLLEEYWCNGLQSYGSSLNKKKTLELTKQTSLSTRRIKNWIDNKKTKQVRRKFGSRSKAPSLKPRKKSAYSCFMAEYISEHATSPENQATTLNKANEAWKKVKGTPEVSKYKEQADNKNRMEAEGATIRQEHKKVMARHILTEIKKMCFQIEELDYEAMFVAIDTEQNLHSSGT
ncbi:uncharacterized protein [Apostichopus japonicus]|uniref:uncharacterized protein isoform X3 n=1 Tax=Stichopus japonicus TaxID=307972 RepID=UPI003AB206CD